MSPPVIQLLAADVLHPATLVLTGRAEDGRSVSVEISGVLPYLWLRLPRTWITENGSVVGYALERLWQDLDQEIRRRTVRDINEAREKKGNTDLLDADNWERDMLRITSCGEVKRFRRFHGFDAEAKTFVKVTFESVRAVRHAREALGATRRWFKSVSKDMCPQAFELAEADIDFTVQACADTGLTPGRWFTLKSHVRPGRSRARSNLGYHVEMAEIVPLDDKAGLAPLRVLSFDIETLTKDLGNGACRFYDGNDPNGKCLCIAACTMVVGKAGMDRFVFAIDPDTLRERQERVPAASGEGTVTIVWLPDEPSVLRAFIAHVNAQDPDFVTGWNTDRFDWGWLALAAERCGVEGFWDFSRFAGFPKAYYNTRLYTDKVLARQLKKKVILQTPGRVPYDLMTWFRRNVQLPSYTLSSVAETYGCGAKDDMPYHLIGEAFKTPEGRLKLAIYCEQDTALVLKLIQNPKVDPLGKDLALCSICGVWPTDLMGRGTQNTLRCKLLRVAHTRGFALPYVAGADLDAEVDAEQAGDGESDDEEEDKEEEEDLGYQGGKVLTAQSGRYTDPIAVFDFSSLYPSCMEEMNICKSSQLTRARALELGVPVVTPPAAELTGRWRTPDGDVEVKENFRTGAITIQGETFRFETDLNEAIACGTRRAELFDANYGLRWQDGAEWTRAPEDVLCFTTREHFYGIVPQFERDLKLDRKAAKKRMAEAEAAGDAAAQVFWNNQQNSIKTLMNGLYGGFGCAKGGVFPEGYKLAAAITATGRGWIQTVKKTMQAHMWVGSDQRWGIGDKPDDAAYVRVIYGDTDSVFVHMAGLNLQTVGAFGDAISTHFSKHILPYPHKLEFEKTYYLFIIWKKKMYSGQKYEGDYSEGAKGKLHSRGIALVRRDNAPLVRKGLKMALDKMLMPEVNREALVGHIADYAALVRASCRSLHRADRPEDHLPIKEFELSGGLSKDLEEYAGALNSSGQVAARLMQINPLERLGAGVRVTFVHRAAHGDARRAEQATLVSDLMANKWSLDADYYTEALLKKVRPILSALYLEDERRRATHASMSGALVTVAHSRASERNALAGQTEAARALDEAIRVRSRAVAKEWDGTTTVAPIFARQLPPPAVPKAPPPKKDKRKEVPTQNAFQVLKTAAVPQKRSKQV